MSKSLLTLVTLTALLLPSKTINIDSNPPTMRSRDPEKVKQILEKTRHSHTQRIVKSYEIFAGGLLLVAALTIWFVLLLSPTVSNLGAFTGLASYSSLASAAKESAKSLPKEQAVIATKSADALLRICNASPNSEACRHAYEDVRLGLLGKVWFFVPAEAPTPVPSKNWVTLKVETIAEHEQRVASSAPTPLPDIAKPQIEFSYTCPDGQRTTKAECCDNRTVNGIPVIRGGCFFESAR